MTKRTRGPEKSRSFKRRRGSVSNCALTSLALLQAAAHPWEVSVCRLCLSQGTVLVPRQDRRRRKLMAAKRVLRSRLLRKRDVRVAGMPCRRMAPTSEGSTRHLTLPKECVQPRRFQPPRRRMCVESCRPSHSRPPGQTPRPADRSHWRRHRRQQPRPTCHQRRLRCWSPCGRRRRVRRCWRNPCRHH